MGRLCPALEAWSHQAARKMCHSLVIGTTPRKWALFETFLYSRRHARTTLVQPKNSRHIVPIIMVGNPGPTASAL